MKPTPRFKVGDRVKVNPKLLTHWICEGYSNPRSIRGTIAKVTYFPQGGFKGTNGSNYGYSVVFDNPVGTIQHCGFDEHELKIAHD